MKKIKVAFVFLFWTTFLLAQDQKPAFWYDIQGFKKQDSVSFPPTDAILLIGSSSFTMWKDVPNYFPSHTIINRGFGGSSLPDVIRYADDIIFSYHPKQIVIYCGENDLAGSDTVTAQLVFTRFKQLFAIIRDHSPWRSYVVYHPRKYFQLVCHQLPACYSIHQQKMFFFFSSENF